MKISRNDQCPCGSGRKYKHCYDGRNTICSLRSKDERKKMLSEHDECEKFIFRFFKEVLQETNIILLKTKDGNDQISARLQMIIIFSLIDMLGSYWYEFLGQNGKTNERAQLWYKTFCATDKNNFYKDLWKELDSECLYNFRNSLVHFFGLGEIKNDIYIALAPNNLPDETHKKWQIGFLKQGKKTIIIRSRDFYDLVREGGIIMLSEWRNMIQRAQTDYQREQEYITGIKRVWAKIQKEGAVRVENN